MWVCSPRRIVIYVYDVIYVVKNVELRLDLGGVIVCEVIRLVGYGLTMIWRFIIMFELYMMYCWC